MLLIKMAVGGVAIMLVGAMALATILFVLSCIKHKDTPICCLMGKPCVNRSIDCISCDVYLQRKERKNSMEKSA